MLAPRPLLIACLLIVNGPVVALTPRAWTQSSEQRSTSADKGGTNAGAASRYSAAVVAKAEKFLEESALRRSGRSILSTESPALSRAMTLATRDRRELELVRDEWKQAADHHERLRQTLDNLNVQDAALNTKLARLNTLDTRSRNQLIAQINANHATTRIKLSQQEKLKEMLDEKRSKLNQAEADYAETILKIRKDYNEIHRRLAEALRDREVRIALRVMSVNFQTPADVTASSLLDSVDRRLTKMEQEIFSESIPLEVEPNGSLYVDVSVGERTTRMVVDSGATLISLPASTADKLGIRVPSDARELRLLVADGREISARAVTLDRVRVGQFEAEDVPAAVLDSSAVVAEPLLGMSFLGNFKFEVDTADKSLKMLRINSDDE